MIDHIMGRSHRTRGPRRPASFWQPVPLRVPLDRPDGTRPKNRVPTENELDQGSDPADEIDDVGGKHVIVIDLA